MVYRTDESKDLMTKGSRSRMRMSGCWWHEVPSMGLSFFTHNMEIKIALLINSYCKD
jgi:hypothetical protein